MDDSEYQLLAYKLQHSIRKRNSHSLKNGTGWIEYGPCAFGYCDSSICDYISYRKKSGFKEEMQKRIGIYIYSISKAVATFLSAILLAFISIILFLCILTLLKVPHIPPSEAMTGYYEELSITRDVEVYYALKMIITSLVCGFAAVFALFISSCISNAYVAVLSPMIGYYLWHCLLSLTYYLLPSSMIWPMISPINLFFGQVWLGSNLFSFLWTTLFLTLVTAFFGICFVRKSCKEAIE